RQRCRSRRVRSGPVPRAGTRTGDGRVCSGPAPRWPPGCLRRPPRNRAPRLRPPSAWAEQRTRLGRKLPAHPWRLHSLRARGRAAGPTLRGTTRIRPRPATPPPDPDLAVSGWHEWPWSLRDLVPEAARAAWTVPAVIVWHFALAG